MTYKDIPGYCDYHAFYKQIFDQLPNGAVMAEVGVYLGHSVAYMATLAKESGKDITIYAVDTFEGSAEHKKKGVENFFDEFYNNLKRCGVYENNRVIPMAIDGRLASLTFEKRALDFVFIDAAHDYDNVKSDIQAWLPKVKKGGTLAGHDYCDSWPGVKKAVDELLPNRTITKNVWSITV